MGIRDTGMNRHSRLLSSWNLQTAGETDGTADLASDESCKAGVQDAVQTRTGEQ